MSLLHVQDITFYNFAVFAYDLFFQRAVSFYVYRHHCDIWRDNVRGSPKENSQHP